MTVIRRSIFLRILISLLKCVDINDTNPILGGDRKGGIKVCGGDYSVTIKSRQLSHVALSKTESFRH